MKRKLVFATNNAHKLEEVRSIIGEDFEILSLNSIECFDDIPETADTLEGNAMLKARYVARRFGFDCFADDTGLEVEALGGAPGVYSARYAGEGKNSQDNVAKLLRELDGATNRKARFRTAIALILNGREELFEGTVEGEIIDQPRGCEGFGYDPVFVPKGFGQTFAEMAAEQKNSISHRGRAVEKLKDFLNVTKN
jgi:XTP/dITP diphosphohydrolase